MHLIAKSSTLLLVLHLATIQCREIHPYIVNGENVGKVGVDERNGMDFIENRGEFPYIAALDENDFHFCAAVIIAEDLALTAEHCVHGSDPSSIQVRAGTLNLWNGYDDTTQILQIESIISHPQFRESDNLNDIAILKLKGKFNFNQFVNKIDMSELTGDKYVGEKLTVIGWGSDKKSIRTGVLNKAELTVIDLQECKSILSQYSIPETMICVVDPQHVQTTCSGDSGGPVVRHNSEDPSKDVFIGIKSGGLCDPQWPTLYADVGKLRSWVLQELEKLK